MSYGLERMAAATTRSVGSSWAFLFALLLTVGWLVSGFLVAPRFNDTWQLVMNTISSIVTFLMVFLIQRSQNKDTLAMQMKLNELIASQRGASNRLINLEDLSEEEVVHLHHRYQELVERAEGEKKVGAPLSIESVLPAEDRPGGPAPAAAH
ncbi:MAG TPA: low affinity iron permease family protein [Gemmataceae bacterium]|nr:low affinity iron permease family protein [Gemmataceae bacterium]